MRRKVARFCLALALLVAVPRVAFAVVDPGDGGSGSVLKTDDRPDPLTTQLLENRKEAIQAKLNGKAPDATKQVARGQYVQLALEDEGAVWTLLGEFADLGHNEIPKPDRGVNNTTYWVEDFDLAHYDQMLYSVKPGVNSLANFYHEQSSGRYGIVGEAADWVQVPGEAASYDDDLGGQAVWQFLEDSLNRWYKGQLADGKTADEINSYLKQYDRWDRYDYDGDGEFKEPDGYIDSFQSVHAGEGEEAGGGKLGTRAIWSHSWYAHYELRGKVGPKGNLDGGIRIGDSDIWVGKYTIQPENGAVGVFAHEFGHDLGLPDLYDTAGGDNGTGFWSVMSSGSWLNEGLDAIGTQPPHMGAWEKLQLGWLNYEIAMAGQKSSHTLGPLEYNTKRAQGLFVVLPQKTAETDIGLPYSGSYCYYSGSGNNLDNLMYKPFALPADSQLTAKVRYNIELDWDYAYLVYSTDDGATWTPIKTNLSTSYDPNRQNFGQGITGVSGGWVDLTADLSGLPSKVLLGFRYWTDPNTGGFGLLIDDIAITGQPLDGAETDAGWKFKGFSVTTGKVPRLYDHYYVAEYRTYRGYDSALQTGPYVFGYLNDPKYSDLVDHFPYQDGLLVSYWDTTQRNNNTIQHPGYGLILPVDAHPDVLVRSSGTRWNNRLQTYDATFGWERTDPLKLHYNGSSESIKSQAAVPVFDDRRSYWDPANPLGSVKTPRTGTQIKIVSGYAPVDLMQVLVAPAK